MPRDFLTFFPRQDIVTIIGIILNISASLEKVGDELKYSKQREMVLQAVGRLPGHPNAAEVYEEVKKRMCIYQLSDSLPKLEHNGGSWAYRKGLLAGGGRQV